MLHSHRSKTTVFELAQTPAVKTSKKKKKAKGGKKTSVGSSNNGAISGNTSSNNDSTSGQKSTYAGRFSAIEFTESSSNETDDENSVSAT